MINLHGRIENVQGFIGALAHDGFSDACVQLQQNRLDGGDFYANWYEIMPVVFAAIKIAGNRLFLPADKALLDKAIMNCIYATDDETGYHHLFGNTQLQQGLVEISDLVRLSKYVDNACRQYLVMAGTCSDHELALCEVELGRRMSAVEGDRARTGLVLRRVLEGIKRTCAGAG